MVVALFLLVVCSSSCKSLLVVVVIVRVLGRGSSHCGEGSRHRRCNSSHSCGNRSSDGGSCNGIIVAVIVATVVILVRISS